MSAAIFRCAVCSRHFVFNKRWSICIFRGYAKSEDGGKNSSHSVDLKIPPDRRKTANSSSQSSSTRNNISSVLSYFVPQSRLTSDLTSRVLKKVSSEKHSIPDQLTNIQDKYDKTWLLQENQKTLLLLMKLLRNMMVVKITDQKVGKETFRIGVLLNGILMSHTSHSKEVAFHQCCEQHLQLINCYLFKGDPGEQHYVKAEDSSMNFDSAHLAMEKFQEVMDHVRQENSNIQLLLNENRLDLRENLDISAITHWFVDEICPEGEQPIYELTGLTNEKQENRLMSSHDRYLDVNKHHYTEAVEERQSTEYVQSHQVLQTAEGRTDEALESDTLSASEDKGEDKMEFLDKPRGHYMMEYLDKPRGHDMMEYLDKPRGHNMMEYLNTARSEAKRSILFRVNSYLMIENVLSDCCQYGEVVKAYIYEEPEHQFILVEFKDEEVVNEVLQTTLGTQMIVASDPSRIIICAGHNVQQSASHKSHNGNFPVLHDEIFPPYTPENLSDAMIRYCSRNSLNEKEKALRFFAYQLLADFIELHFPAADILTFGSLVNSFGNSSSDVDISLEAKPLVSRSQMRTKYRWTPLYHQELNMTALESLLPRLNAFTYHSSLPFARVPIVKLLFQPPGMESCFRCELSFNNPGGVNMSKWLYILTSKDPRVQVLGTVIKRWASVNLTRLDQTFVPLMMMIFFMENQKIIPSLQDMLTQDTLNTASSSVALFNPEFRDDISFNDTSTVDMILKEFFAFYNKFNFRQHGMCILTGKTIKKNNKLGMVMKNPFTSDVQLSNCCRNIHRGRFEELKISLGRFDKKFSSDTLNIINVVSSLGIQVNTSRCATQMSSDDITKLCHSKWSRVMKEKSVQLHSIEESVQLHGIEESVQTDRNTSAIDKNKIPTDKNDKPRQNKKRKKLQLHNIVEK